MSVSTGTASNYLDLLDKLVTFLTTDATLTAASQAWSLLKNDTAPSNGDDRWIYLKAPGLSGSEVIYINIAAYHNLSSDVYNLAFGAATGFNSSLGIWTQPGVSPGAHMCLWNQAIPYTFIANGQRFVIIAQVSTVYESAYAGKFLPYATPTQYPYPVVVGATASSGLRYSDTTDAHRAFFDPGAMYIYWMDGTWKLIRNYLNGAYTDINVNPFINGSSNAPTWMRENLDGSYPLFPCQISSSNPSTNMLGELDGVFFVPGYQQSSGNTITIGSNTYTVVQNTFNTSKNSFAAILEA